MWSIRGISLAKLAAPDRHPALHGESASRFVDSPFLAGDAKNRGDVTLGGSLPVDFRIALPRRLSHPVNGGKARRLSARSFTGPATPAQSILFPLRFPAGGYILRFSRPA